MIAAQRRSTDEIIGVIKHRESARKLWFLVTAIAYVVTTAVLIRGSGHGWSPTQAHYIYPTILNGAACVGSILLYRSWVKGGERIGYIMPVMLAILSLVVVWMVTH
jgi:hypothetical protein